MNASAAQFYDNSPPSSQEDWLRIFSDHAVWLASAGKQGRRANLRGYDLRGYDFTGVNLSEASLRGADLSGSTFFNAVMRGADLAEAVLDNANFRHANLEGATLSRARAGGAYFEDANMAGANLQSASFNESVLSRANLHAANLRDVRMQRANLTHAVMTEANMRGGDFTDSLFESANLANAEAKDAVFDHARFLNAFLQNAQFKGATFSGVNFAEADFAIAQEIDLVFQIHSFEKEKKSIASEVENLEKIRNEIKSFEQQIVEQKQYLAEQKKLLEKVNVLEHNTSAEIGQHTQIFRRAAMGWFVIVAMFAMVIIYQVALVGRMNAVEVGVVMLVSLAILGLHCVLAMKSNAVAKKLEDLVQSRNEVLAEMPVSVATDLMPFVPTLKSDSHYRASENGGITYV